MSERLYPLLELTKTRLREFARERGAIFWVFGFPLLMALGLGWAFRSRPPDLPVVAVTGQATPALANALLSSKRLVAEREPAAAAGHALATGKVDLLVELTPSGPVFHFDPTQDRAPIARAVASDVLQSAAGRNDPLTIRDKLVSEQGSRYIDFLLPGLIGMNLMGSSMWGVGYNLVLARKRRLLRRYAVTPMRRSDFLLSYFLSRGLFLVLELGVLLAFGALVFDVRVQGSLAAVVLVAFIGAASFAAISLVIGARVETLEGANGWMNFVQLPMWLLSGVFFSYERFPGWMHEPIRLLPLTAAIDAIRAITNEGASLLTLGHELVVLAAWGAVGFVLALKTFRWQ